MNRPEGWGELFGALPTALADTAGVLGDLVHRVAPDAVAVPYPGYRSMSYGVGRRKNTEGVVYIAAHARWINLGFYRGTALDDRAGLLQGTGKMLRHVRLAAPDAETAPLEVLVATSFAERRSALGIA